MKKSAINKVIGRGFGSFVILIVFGTLLGMAYEASELFHSPKHIGLIFLFLGLKAAKWSAIGWSAYLVLTALFIRLKHDIFLKKDSIDIRKATNKLLADTELWSFAIVGLFPSIFISICAALLYFKFRNPDLLFLMLPTFARVIWVKVRFVQPPVMLYLTTSNNSEKIFNHYDFKTFIQPFRVAAMLEYSTEKNTDQRMYGKLINSVYLDIFRTVFTPDWRDAVAKLIEFVAVIVVDARFITEQTIYEAHYVISNDFLYKTIFLSDENGSAPLLDKIGVSDCDLRVCKSNFSDAFRYFKLVFFDDAMPTKDSPLNGFNIKDIGDPHFHFKSTTSEHYCDIGNRYLASGKLVLAEQAFFKALSSTPQGHESLWTNLAIVSLNLGNFGDALERVEKALAKHGKHPNALLTAGMVYERNGDINNANRKFREFLDIADPSDAARIRYARSRLH